jgi:CheY-like chemotaxis protein
MLRPPPKRSRILASDPSPRPSPRPDLIVLDVRMPEVSGSHVMAALAKLPDHGPQAPILVVTADSTSEAHRRALFYGAIDLRDQAV